MSTLNAGSERNNPLLLSLFDPAAAAIAAATGAGVGPGVASVVVTVVVAPEAAAEVTVVVTVGISSKNRVWDAVYMYVCK
jgi:hypothetical protein